MNVLQTVKQFKLELFDPQDIPQISHVRCTNPSVQFNNRTHSVIDPKFGPVSHREQCTTCHSLMTDCTGHFGHIPLALPVFQPFFLNDVYKIVQKACYNCLKPAKEDHCVHCNCKQGKWSRELQTKDRFVHKYEYRQRELTIKNVYTVLKEYDNVFQPEQPKSWLLLQNMLVLPVCARPSIVTSGMVSHHAMTHCYASIVKENNLLGIFVQQGQSPHVIKQQWRRLQDNVYKLFDARYSTDDRFQEGIRQRLDGKQGRFRKNLLGKRCNFSARTVIGGDPSCKFFTYSFALSTNFQLTSCLFMFMFAVEIDQLGVPRSIAMRMTFPEHVNRYNLQQMKECVQIGPSEIGGALYVQKHIDGSLYDLSMIQSLGDCAYRLQPGDIVERMMRDEDLVLFNRQPSLHKFSVSVFSKRFIELI